MRVTVLAYGSRGDVQPYVALGVGLLRRGHTVRLAAPERFRGFVESFGLAFSGLPGDPAELLRMAGEQADIRAGVLRTMRTMLAYALPLAEGVIAGVEAACQGTDAIVHSLLLSVIGHELALRQGAPDACALVFPVFTPTGAFANPIFPPLRLGAAYNYLTHVLFSQAAWQSSRLGYWLVRRKRRDLPRLSGWPFRPSRDGQRIPVLYGISPQVLARPADWGSQAHLTGYWFLNEGRDWEPPPGLQAFLEAGPPPVYLGFGSTVPKDAARLTGMALEALRLSGQRGVLQAGWGGLAAGDLPGSVYRLESAPFDGLFPRLAAAVHHGGVGTTAEALRAGLPSVVTPFIADQAFWGRQVQRLGAGPAPIPHYRLSAEKLAAAIRQAVEDEDIRRHCSELRRRLKDEDGVGRAVEILTEKCGG